MQRQEIIALVERRALDTARRLFGLSQEPLSLVAGYEGCANLVYQGQRAGQPVMLRLSYRPDRTAAQSGKELVQIWRAMAEGSFLNGTSIPRCPKKRSMT